MTYIAYNPYHDAVIAVYDKKTNSFHTFDFEKMFKSKHMNLFNEEDRDKASGIYKYIADYLEDHGISSECEIAIFSSHYVRKFFKENVPKTKDRFSDQHQEIYKNVSIPFFKQFKPKSGTGNHHNLSHAASAYYQSPFDKGVVITQDAGGDANQCSVYASSGPDDPLENVEHLDRDDLEGRIWQMCNMYNHIGAMCSLVKTEYTYKEDLAGKLMGLSAYGECDNYDYNIAYSSGVLQRRVTKEQIQDFQKQANYALGMQHAFEDVFIDYVIRPRLDFIEEYGNNLVLSGGGSMNILLNAKIQRLFPQINLFIPPNPTDDGLPYGALIVYLTRKGILDMSVGNRPDFAYGGIEIQKEDISYNRTKTTVEEVSKHLNDGKIIGVVQGRHELGKRALGNRSILANASIKGMKDRINKIKNREFYRPFAPMCRLEDAEKYFDAPSYDNLRFMNIAVITREQYREQLESITHVDNTARLQTVTKDQNELMYDILSNIEGDVLLNTSFNVAGEPILNHLSSALKVLRETPLDYVLYREGKQLYFISD